MICLTAADFLAYVCPLPRASTPVTQSTGTDPKNHARKHEFVLFESTEPLPDAELSPVLWLA